MARYSRRVGPPANFTLTGLRQVIPGMSITRRFGTGEILIAVHVSFKNNTGATRATGTNIRADGVDIMAPFATVHIDHTREDHSDTVHLLPIQPGEHTIELTATDFGAGGVTVLANGSELIVIELPRWDQDTDIT